MGASTGPVCDGTGWLEANQNPDGSWGASLPLIVTGTVVETLVAVKPDSPVLSGGADWLAGETAANHEFLARQIIALSGIPEYGGLVSSLTAQLLAARNPATTNTTLPNWPEGGWGLAAGYETDCLTTALALTALDAAGLNGGFKVINRSVAPGTTNTHEWDIASAATTVRIIITVAGSTVRVRMKQGTPPGPGDPFFNLPPGSWLLQFPPNPFTPGHNFVTVQNVTGAAATYTMTASYQTPSFDTRSLDEALEYLRQSQNGDGGWGIQRGQPTEFYTTLHAILTLLRYLAYEFSGDVAQGTAYVRSQQLGDGSFGFTGTPIPYVTALGALTLIRSQSYPFDADTEEAITALFNQQDMDGSWDGEAYDTALAVRAHFEHNQAPSANAGPDQMVFDADGNCFADVTLSGSAMDVDGMVVNYTWTEDTTTIATGAMPAISLAVGVHTIVLTVTDNNCRTATDMVVITVASTGSPPDSCQCCFGSNCNDFGPVSCLSSGGTPVPGECGFEACCLPGDICQITDATCCQQSGGTSIPGGMCAELRACCLADGTCADLDPLCCALVGGAAQGDGSACTAAEACCLPDDTCELLDSLCCADAGGAALGAETACTATEACCLPDDRCQDMTPECCLDGSGVPQGGGSACMPLTACCLPDNTCQSLDPLCCVEQDGTSGAGTCDPVQACCLPGGVCALREPECCLGAGGVPEGVGTTCAAAQACCLPDGTCQLLDVLCCADLSGTPQGPGSVCAVIEACCFSDGSCQDLERCQCMAQNGTSAGAGSLCANQDSNGDGIDDTCDTCTSCQLYADLSPPGGDCNVDVGDILCSLDCFSGVPPCSDVGDISPCGGDGFCDVGDVLAALDSFAGIYACPHPCPP